MIALLAMCAWRVLYICMDLRACLHLRTFLLPLPASFSNPCPPPLSIVLFCVPGCAFLQVVLESVKTGGQYIHTSTAVLPAEKNIAPTCHDVNISVSPTALTVYPHMPHRTEEDKDVRGGDLIQLFHKEISAYLAAEGAFYESTPREDVHMRVREPDPRRPHRLLPPTSAVSVSWEGSVGFCVCECACLHVCMGGCFARCCAISFFALRR